MESPQPLVNGQLNPSDSLTAPTPPPRIEAEPLDTIHVGAGGRLFVPREDLDELCDVSTELPSRPLTLKIVKPGPLEFFNLARDSELPTSLLIVKDSSGYGEQYYYVHPDLRRSIASAIRKVRVLVYWSLKERSPALWAVKITPGHRTYESINHFLSLNQELFRTDEFLMRYDRTEGIYRFRHRPITGQATWPGEDTQVLLGKAIGHEGMILSAEHPLYRQLTDGEELFL